MSNTGQKERREVYFYGHVQGVGFRYTTLHVARRFSVTGFVKNLPDGSVQLVAEGEPDELDRFIAAVQNEMHGYIRRVEQQRLPATGEFQRFEIRF